MFGIKGVTDRTMNPRALTRWFSIISIILVSWGVVFAFFGLDVLPVANRGVLLPWASALYGAIMAGWGTTLFLFGGIAFRRNDAELMKVLLVGIVTWLVIEALFSAYLGVWFNVGVDIVVLGLFSFPLIMGIRSQMKQKPRIDKTALDESSSRHSRSNIAITAIDGDDSLISRKQGQDS